MKTQTFLSEEARLDTFAGLAMQAMISRGSLTAQPHHVVADEAYRMAIAMLESKTREKWVNHEMP